MMNSVLDGKTTSSNISYYFMSELITIYSDLIKEFKQKTTNVNLEIPTTKWLETCNFCDILVFSYRYFKANVFLPYIKFNS